jgi:regulator of cell morphogenesis and NO signaling
MTVSPDTVIGHLASEFPQTIRVFQRLGIEFCCDGQRRLGELCHERQQSFDQVAAALSRALASPPSPVRHDWSTRPLAELTAHIIEAFHEPLGQELPRLHRMAVRVQRHCNSCQLTVVLGELERFCAVIEQHIARTERDLFPLICRTEAGERLEGDRGRFHELRTELEADYAKAGLAVRILRTVTDRYDPPAQACGTLRTLYEGLKELEQLVQLHVHLENNVLFPRAAALLSEARTARSS